MMVKIKNKESGKIFTVHPIDAFEQVKIGEAEYVDMKVNEKDNIEVKKAAKVKKLLKRTEAGATTKGEDSKMKPTEVDKKPSEDETPKPIKKKRRSKKS